MENAKFLPVALAADIPQGEVIGVTIGNHRIALYNLGGQFFATDGVCTHSEAYLAEGYVEGDVIECPMHSGQFDIRTGRAVKPPCVVDLRTFAVKVEGGQVFVALPEGSVEPRSG